MKKIENQTLPSGFFCLHYPAYGSIITNQKTLYYEYLSVIPLIENKSHSIETLK